MYALGVYYQTLRWSCRVTFHLVILYHIFPHRLTSKCPGSFINIQNYIEMYACVSQYFTNYVSYMYTYVSNFDLVPMAVLVIINVQGHLPSTQSIPLYCIKTTFTLIGQGVSKSWDMCIINLVKILRHSSNIIFNWLCGTHLTPDSGFVRYLYNFALRWSALLVYSVVCSVLMVCPTLSVLLVNMDKRWNWRPK